MAVVLVGRTIYFLVVCQWRLSVSRFIRQSARHRQIVDVTCKHAAAHRISRQRVDSQTTAAIHLRFLIPASAAAVSRRVVPTLRL